jgi:hypothetical protein
LPPYFVHFGRNSYFGEKHSSFIHLRPNGTSFHKISYGLATTPQAP